MLHSTASQVHLLVMGLDLFILSLFIFLFYIVGSKHMFWLRDRSISKTLDCI